ncbi:hypothetical protein JQ615_06090 [Bradyrhizobium jicamae]|uniref:Uncharacterized protein n=1 Tax=Bradyrhizobium jicamae TaxID=280332 RepID=A0ABS5FDU8_9BRAD|nr:hypothetical protein [Bradyrhizobium jicamae]MBR0794953.1 hypothetical protein [Bradyrhizobium jicamae]MBR0939069.1 hypothetical protein [Bradyrhizobium jicamae]
MSAFQVQPDWYEEYWLKPKETSPPAVTKWRRLILQLHFYLYAATFSGLAAFIRSRTGGAM